MATLETVDIGPGYGGGWWWKGCAGSRLIWPKCFRAIANWLTAFITFDRNSMVLCAVLHSMSSFLCRPRESQVFCRNLWRMGCSYRGLWESMCPMTYYGIYGSARFYGSKNRFCWWMYISPFSLLLSLVLSHCTRNRLLYSDTSGITDAVAIGQ